MISGSGSSGEGDRFRSRQGAWPRPWRTNAGEGSDQLFSRERKLKALEREREELELWSRVKDERLVKRPVELYMVVDFFGGCFFLFFYFFISCLVVLL